MSEIEESFRQYELAFGDFARKARGGVVTPHEGYSVLWSGAQWPILNQVLWTSPLASAEQIDPRLAESVDILKSKAQIGLVTVAGRFIPDALCPAFSQAVARHGLVEMMQVRGMAADRLLPPSRPEPPLTYLHSSAADLNREICLLNAHAYDVPLEWGEEMASLLDVCGENACGVVGYANGKAVCCTVTYPLEQILYVALVATLPGEQRKGYAEAVLRRSVEAAAEATGFTRTVLHATPAGYPVYKRMGYHETTSFVIYVHGGGH